MILAALICWGIGWLTLFRIPCCKATGNNVDGPAVSVIIPARNEAHNLPGVLTSINSQLAAPFEILVVDDDSSDGTAAVARAYGATVLTSAPLPKGWRGKTWACHQGADVAKGDLFCFVDADTRFEPDGLSRVLGEWRQQKGALSLAVWHDVQSWIEQLSAFFNLMTAVGVGAFTALGRRLRPAGLFGPFLLVSRRDYRAAGGHAAVKAHILENVFLAACFKQAGVPAVCYSGRGVISVRMYPGGCRQLSEGWAKAFAAGAANTPAYLLLPSIAWIGGAIIAFSMLPWSILQPAMQPLRWVVVYLLYVLQFCFLLRRLGHFKVLTSVVYPLPLLFYLVVFTWSSLLMQQKHKVTWKGRSIHTDSVANRGPRC